MSLYLLICLTGLMQQKPVQAVTPQQNQGSQIPKISTSRAQLNGPVYNDPNYQPQKSGHTLFTECLDAIKKKWLPMTYQSAKAVELDVDLKLNVKPPRETGLTDYMEFEVQLDGVALPNERYNLKVTGDVGNMELIRSQTRKLMIYHSGKGFADQTLPRGKHSNIDSYRSYALRHLGVLSDQILKNGGYRLKYLGSGNYKGQLIDRISISKIVKRKRNRKGPIPMSHLWTFWQSGKYEVWIFQGSKFPAAVFYSNPEDHIYANFTIDYNEQLLPELFVLQNNSSGFEGHTEIRFDFDENRLLELVSFRFHTSEGHQMSFDARLNFLKEVEDGLISGIPPFGYQKMNQDHLKILVMAQMAGNLLNLRQHGLKLKNFKF